MDKRAMSVELSTVTAARGLRSFVAERLRRCRRWLPSWCDDDDDDNDEDDTDEDEEEAAADDEEDHDGWCDDEADADIDWWRCKWDEPEMSFDET